MSAYRGLAPPSCSTEPGFRKVKPQNTDEELLAQLRPRDRVAFTVDGDKLVIDPTDLWDAWGRIEMRRRRGAQLAKQDQALIRLLKRHGSWYRMYMCDPADSLTELDKDQRRIAADLRRFGSLAHSFYEAVRPEELRHRSCLDPRTPDAGSDPSFSRLRWTPPRTAGASHRHGAGRR